MALTDRFNLEKQFIFYASYHDNPFNKIIHFICIWPILWTATVFLAGTSQWFPRSNFFDSLPYHQNIVLNYSVLVPLIYIPWYLLLDYRAGSLASIMIIGVYLSSNYFVLQYEDAWKTALAIHIGCWILQFIGHGLFERRAPALFKSLDQAFITAPLFVVLEGLFPLGYRKQMFKRMMKQVKYNVHNWRKEQ